MLSFFPFASPSIAHPRLPMPRAIHKAQASAPIRQFENFRSSMIPILDHSPTERRGIPLHPIPAHPLDSTIYRTAIRAYVSAIFLLAACAHTFGCAGRSRAKSETSVLPRLPTRSYARRHLPCKLQFPTATAAPLQPISCRRTLKAQCGADTPS